MQSHKINLKLDNVSNNKEQNSTFLLTINSNASVLSQKDPKAIEFKENILNILDNIIDYIITNEGYDIDNSMIINIDSHTEIGTKNHRIHNHSVINIQHNSNIKIDTKAITKDYGYYVNVKYVKHSNDLTRMLNYLRKQINT